MWEALAATAIYGAAVLFGLYALGVLGFVFVVVYIILMLARAVRRL